MSSLSEKNYFGSLAEQLSVVKTCRKYKVRIWQCPNFLFPIMGLVTIIGMLATYYLGVSNNLDPYVVALLVLGISAVLFLIGHFIVTSFQMLAETNQIKSDFISIASHQLRTPLSSLRWTLEFLLNGNAGELNPKHKHYLETLHQENAHMIRLVNNLLDVSRIEAGLVNFMKSPVSIKEITEEALNDLGEYIKSREIKVELQAQDNLPIISGDKEKIKMSIQNLVDNAIKYSLLGKKIIVKIIKENRFLKFSVQDAGLGIPHDAQKNIFQKFYRAENTRKHSVNGSGLGLFIAKSNIEAMRGKIGFASQENHGSCFWFKLPIK